MALWDQNWPFAKYRFFQKKHDEKQQGFICCCCTICSLRLECREANVPDVQLVYRMHIYLFHRLLLPKHSFLLSKIFVAFKKYRILTEKYDGIFGVLFTRFCASSPNSACRLKSYNIQKNRYIFHDWSGCVYYEIFAASIYMQEGYGQQPQYIADFSRTCRTMLHSPESMV